jgi:hypothetical protein
MNHMMELVQLRLVDKRSRVILRFNLVPFD